MTGQPELVLEFAAPAVPQSINAMRGMHGAAWGRLMRPWHDLAWVTSLNAYNRGRVPWLGHRAIKVQVALPFKRGGRRDPHNYTGTVVKAVVDGLTGHRKLVPDDTAEWVEVLDPRLVVRQDALVTVTITERNPTT